MGAGVSMKLHRKMTKTHQQFGTKCSVHNGFQICNFHRILAQPGYSVTDHFEISVAYKFNMMKVAGDSLH